MNYEVTAGLEIESEAGEGENINDESVWRFLSSAP